MECPNESFLELFARNPDAALVDWPEFEEHLSQCDSCQRNLDRIASSTDGMRPMDLVLSQPHANSVDMPTIAGYELFEVVGSGGFGVVYRGVHTASGRPVAVKVIESINPDHWRRIVLEREALLKCDHPYVVTLLDYGQRTGCCYFVYRWMDQSLAQFLQKNAMVDLDQATRWIAEIADAVAYIHGLGLVHRDLKPSNILLSATGSPKIADFGIAKDITATESSTTVSQPIGTPSFMAPEQTGRTNSKVGFATDVYGLGAVLYAIMTGRPPFMGASPIQILDQVVHTAPIAPRLLRSDIPRDLEVICLKCLEKEQSDRYSSATELAEDLKRFKEGRPIKARPVSSVARLWRLSKRHPKVAGMIGGLAALFVLGAILLVVVGRRSQQQRIEFAAQSLLKTIGNASPDKLNQLYFQADEFEPNSLLKSLKVSNSDPSIDSLTRLRWQCVSHDPLSSMIPAEQLVEGLRAASAEEIPIIVQRLKSNRCFESNEYLSSLRKELLETRSGAQALRVASLLSEVDAAWDQWGMVSSKIVSGLADCPAAEISNWGGTLQNISPELMRVIFAKDNESDSSMDATNSGDRFIAAAQKTSHLDSAIIRSIAWQWAKADSEQIVNFIQSVPITSLGVIGSLNAVQRDKTIDALRDRWRAIADEKKSAIQPRAIDGELAQIIDRDGGFITRRRGFVSSTPLREASKLMEVLKRNGLSLVSLQPYSRDGKDVFAAAFEESTDDCKIDWSIPVGDLESAVESRRREGFEAVSFWVESHVDFEYAAVLWRRGKWQHNRFVVGSDAVELASSSLSKIDSDDLETEFRHQSIEFGRERHDFGLITQKTRSKRDEEFRRFSHVMPRSFGKDPILSSVRYVEYLADGCSYLSLPRCSPESHAEQSEPLRSYGYEPIDLCVDSETGQMVSQWRKDAIENQAYQVQRLASIAIATWVLGESDLLLESLEHSRDPTLRTQVIGSLGYVVGDPTYFLKVLGQELTPGQYQGLLLAMSSWRSDQVAASRAEIQIILRRLWEHPDAGVHFAADHVTRVFRLSPQDAITRLDLREPIGFESLPAGRNWFYGPFGLPFIIVQPTELQLVGTDEQMPWINRIDRRLAFLDREFAVCAIETPEWLMRKYLSESESFVSNRRVPDHNMLYGPAAGYRLDTMLKFCRWMSEQEGLPQESICQPAYEAIVEGMRFPDDYLDRGGYRLPTNLEWEIACRCGTWTSSFLGDHSEFPSGYTWDSSNSKSNASRVATRMPSPFGLFDVLGNVYEAAIGESNERFDDGQTFRLRNWTLKPSTVLEIRGGSFLSSRIYCSSGSQHHISAHAPDINAGFRIVRTMKRDAAKSESHRR